MEPTPRALRNYLTNDEREPFEDWIKGLKDGKGRGIVRDRLNRIRLGNFGDSHPVGDSVHELRIDFGPGYRVYFGEDGDSVILLCGGDKSTQQSDILKAKRFWSDYNA